MKLLGDRILVKPASIEETTASGIVLPDSAQEKPQTGTIVSVGSGRIMQDGKIIPVDVTVGDKVIFSKYAGVEIDHDSETHLLVRESDILAIVE